MNDSENVILIAAWCQSTHAEHERRVAKHRRRARERGLPATLSTAQWLDMLHEQNHICCVGGCNRKANSLEHLVPLCAGGGTTPSNVVPMCLFHNSMRNDFYHVLNSFVRKFQRFEWHAVADLADLVLNP